MVVFSLGRAGACPLLQRQISRVANAVAQERGRFPKEREKSVTFAPRVGLRWCLGPVSVVCFASLAMCRAFASKGNVMAWTDQSGVDFVAPRVLRVVIAAVFVLSALAQSASANSPSTEQLVFRVEGLT